MSLDTSTPVLLLGGNATTLSLARSLGRRGVKIAAVMDQSVSATTSRFCKHYIPIPPGADSLEVYREVTLSGQHPQLEGSVLLSCADDAVNFVATHHAELSDKFLLERHDPKLQLDLLNKEKTLAIATAAGLAVPANHSVNTMEDVRALAPELVYPVMLKPRLTYLLYQLRKKKYLLARDEQELITLSERLFRQQIEFMLCEMIPGPDSMNCSYYTYRDASGTELLSLTKRCVRRHPINEGAGTFQITDYLPEVEALGRRFFDHVDYRGLGSIEFKRDIRDGRLKVMECNNRFTAVQEQLVRCGADSALLTYADITGQNAAPVTRYRPNVAIWSPVHDLAAFRDVKFRYAGTSWMDWLRSLRHAKLVFPFFSWRDPAPFLLALRQQLARIARKLLKGIRPTG